jgi:hypothetical protein
MDDCQSFIDRAPERWRPRLGRHDVIGRLLRAVLRGGVSTADVRARDQLARGLDQIVGGAGRRRLLTRSLIEPAVAVACTPSADSMARILRDASRHVAPESLVAIREFLTDGCSSPLYRREPAAAFVAIAALEGALLQAPARAAR